MTLPSRRRLHGHNSEVLLRRHRRALALAKPQSSLLTYKYPLVLQGCFVLSMLPARLEVNFSQYVALGMAFCLGSPQLIRVQTGS